MALSLATAWLKFNPALRISPPAGSARRSSSAGHRDGAGPVLRGVHPGLPDAGRHRQPRPVRRRLEGSFSASDSRTLTVISRSARADRVPLIVLPFLSCSPLRPRAYGNQGIPGPRPGQAYVTHIDILLSQRFP